MSKLVQENLYDNSVEESKYDSNVLIDEDKDINEIFLKSLQSQYHPLSTELLKSVLDQFVYHANKFMIDTIWAFKQLFAEFSIVSYHESQNKVHIKLSLFSYIPLIDDPFLPECTAFHFVQKIITEYYKIHKGKTCDLHIIFQING